MLKVHIYHVEKFFQTNKQYINDLSVENWS